MIKEDKIIKCFLTKIKKYIYINKKLENINIRIIRSII